MCFIFYLLYICFIPVIPFNMSQSMSICFDSVFLSKFCIQVNSIPTGAWGHHFRNGKRKIYYVHKDVIHPGLSPSVLRADL